MSKLITRIKRLALALCFVTPLVSWADAITAVNPVTGETETYTYKYVGTGDWTATDWQNAADPVANPDKAPQTPGSDVWDPLLIDGAYTLTAPTLEGWAIRLGLYNGAQVTVPTLNKIQAGTTMWFTVDATSKLTLSLPGTGHLGDNQNVNFYVAAPQGLVFNSNFATSQNDTDTFNYYLAGNGSVSHQAISAGSHVIKMADVTLTGTSQVSSKTLVTFGSGTTKTFTAVADIKVYDGTTLKETVGVTSVRSAGTAIVDTSSTLTTSDAVGSCEIVQCTDGIVLYYVDGDPSSIVAKEYKPSISVNFTSGTALSTHADVGVGDYAIPGTSWNNLIGNNGTLSTVTQVDSMGEASTVAGVGVTISGTRGYWACGSVSAETDLRQGYIDDAAGANASPQVVVSGIPYYSYYAVVYFSNNDDNVKFGYVTINGTNYKWDSENSALVKCDGADTDSWGASSPTAWTEGGNYIVTPTFVNADGTFTIVSHRLSNNIRSGIAAIQIVEVPKQAADGELVINVSGDTPYPVSEDATYTTVYVTGAGTLAFSGEGTITTTTLNVGPGATVPMGSSITPTTVTGAGTVVYDGAQPSTTLGFDNSANWRGTVWVKNVGGFTNNKVDTCLGTDTATASDNALNNWGNVNSFVKFTNVKGYVGAATCPWTLVLEDDGDNYAWYDNNGWTARASTFGGLKGSGTFHDVENTGCRAQMSFADVSGFTGTITVKGKVVCLGGTVTGSTSSGFGGTIEIASGASVTLPSGKTWTTGDGGFLVNGTLNANGTLASSSSANAVRGSGTVVFAGKMPSPTTDAWWKNAAWTGTVQIKSAAFTGVSGVDTYLDVNKYGNDGSILELNNCSGWLPVGNTSGDNVCAVPLKITGTLTINDGYSSRKFTINKLLGNGAIYTTSNGATVTIQVLSADDFAGYVQLNSKRVIFGETVPETFTSGQIYVGEGFTFTVPNSNVAWYGTGGITLAGELKAAALSNFGGGTTITTTDTGVFTLVSNSDTDDMNVDYTRIQGTGTLKFEGSAYRCISTNNFPTAMIVENNLTAGLLHRIPDLEVTIGSLSGSGYLRSDWGGSAGDRSLKVLQAKDTTWSGKFWTANPHRFGTLRVAPGASTAGTLTISATHETAESTALQVDSGASVNLTGTWVGATTVAGTFGGTGTLTGDLTFSNGATFKAFAADDADGLFVSGTVGYPAEGTVTVDVSAIEPETDVALLKAADLDASKFALADGTPEGYSLDVVDGVLTLTVPRVTITVPSILNTTVTVKIGDNTIGTSSGDYNVAPDSVVTVTYAAVDGYEISGTTEYTIDTSKSETTFDPAGKTEVKQYVASITAGETTTKYTTLQAAIDEVAQNKDIVLLANEADGATVAREVTFSIVPGEYTHGDIAAGGDYILTVTPQEGKTRYSFAQAFIAVTINEVRTLYTMMTASTGIEAANAGPIGTTIEILSGVPQDYVDSLPMFDLNTDTGVFTKVANPVAAVYEGVMQQQVYRTLAEAVTAATSGQTVKLLENVSESITIAAGKTVTLDLGGKTLTATGDAITNNGTLTLQNGAITATGAIVRNLGSNSAVTVESGTYTSTGGNGIICGSSDKTVAAPTATGCSVTVNGGTFNVVEMALATGRTAGATITVNGGTFTSSDNALIGDNGTAGCSGNVITVNGGTFNGSITTAGYIACGIYVANNDTVSVNGGTFTIAGGCGIAVRAGVVTVADGVTIAATGTATGWVGDKKTKLPCAAVIYDVNPGAYPGYDSATSKVAITGGTFTSDVAAVQMNGEGLVTTTDNTLTVAEGYKWAETATVGVYQLVVQSQGIDPDDPESKQEVVIDPTGKDEDQIKEAAVEEATVTIPEAVSPAAKAAITDYKSYFELKATVTNPETGACTVEIVGFKDNVVQDVNEDAVEALKEAVADTETTTVAVEVPAGLYYVVETYEALGTPVDSQEGWSTGTTTPVDKPTGTTQGFIRVRISTAEITD